jgi:FkbM family methyltransferase
MKIFMQIGSNIGEDHFSQYISSVNEPCRVILIEANKECIKSLRSNYNSIRSPEKKVHIFNIGIVPRHTKSDILYFYDGPIETCSLLSRKSHGPTCRKMKFRSFSFNEFCEKLCIKDIDFLMMDIEGLDYEILLDIDLNSINIKKLVFEIWPHEDDDDNNVFRSGPSLLADVLNKFSDYEHTPEYGYLNSICLIKR